MMQQRSSNPSCSLKSIAPVVAMLACILCVCTAAFAQFEPRPEPSRIRITLPDAARHFGASTSWRPDEWKLSLSHEDRRAEVLVGSDRLIVDDYLIILSAPVKAEKGTVTMALADSAALFTRLLAREVTQEEILSAGLASRQKAEPLGPNLIKTVRYISYPEFTRIIIGVSAERRAGELEVDLVEGESSLTVEFHQSRFAGSEESINVSGRIVDLLERVQSGSDAKLIIKTVPEEVKYEMQKHADPPRVVVDISPAVPDISPEFLADPVPPARTGRWSEPEPIDDPQKFTVTTIVVDPGHGGKDKGARGRGGLYEKDVTLEIARKLKKYIEEKPGVKVVLTRTADYFVPLKERTAIANHAKNGMPADLFISIHTNAHKSQKVEGFESFYISDAIDPDAEATAAMENASINLELDADDPIQAALTPILWDLQFTEYVAQSSELALLTQRELARRLTTRNRGVRQGRFIVLAGVAMPSVLIEVGFISNRIEEAKLKTSDFRGKCAAAIAEAVSVFKKRHDMRLGLLREESGH